MKTRAVLWMAALLVVSVTWLIKGQSGAPREDAYRHNNLGVAHLERYDFRAAAGAFRQALAIDPALTIARLNFALTREPFNATAAYGLATALVRAGAVGGPLPPMPLFPRSVR